MPTKRKIAPSITVETPKRHSTRARQLRPGDGSLDSPAHPVPNDPTALAEFVTTSLEAHRADVAGQLSDFDATLQANNHQLNDIIALLNDVRQRLDGGTAAAISTVSFTPPIPSGNPPLPSNDILSRWPWVDRSLVENIANGEFNIYDLPKLHRDEYLRNRHIIKSVDGIVHPLSGGKPHIVQAKTKLQSSLKDFETLLSTWMVYVSIRTSYAPERGPGLAIWTERVAFHVTLSYEFTAIVNYIVSYFQKHQNSTPEAWFNIDAELHSEHFGNAAQRAVNSLRTSSVKPPVSKFGSMSKTPSLTPIAEQICRSWNRTTGCKIKEQTNKDCLRRHVCAKCLDPGHKEHNCTKFGSD